MKRFICIVIAIIAIMICVIVPTSAYNTDAPLDAYIPSYDYLYGPTGAPSITIPYGQEFRWAIIYNQSFMGWTTPGMSRVLYIVPYVDKLQFDALIANFNSLGAQYNQDWVFDGWIDENWRVGYKTQLSSGVTFLEYSPVTENYEFMATCMSKWGCVPTFEFPIERANWTEENGLAHLAGWLPAYGGQDWNIGYYLAPLGENETGEFLYEYQHSVYLRDNYIPVDELVGVINEYDYQMIPRGYMYAYEVVDGRWQFHFEAMHMSKIKYFFKVDGSYASGFSEGFDEAKQMYFDSRYDLGYNVGYDKGISDSTEYSVPKLVVALFSAPAEFITTMLDFDVFGVNVATTVKALFTIALLIFAISMIVRVIKT